MRASASGMPASTDSARLAPAAISVLARPAANWPAYWLTMRQL